MNHFWTFYETINFTDPKEGNGDSAVISDRSIKGRYPPQEKEIVTR
jgi:hypothetical protein